MYKIIGADQKEYGPVSADQLRQWIRDGRVNAHTRARLESTGDWQPLSSFGEFAGAFQPGVATQPMPPGTFSAGALPVGGSRETALQAVKGPAIALIVISSLGVALYLLVAVGGFIGVAMGRTTENESDTLLGSFLCLFGAAMNGLVLFGAIKMMRLQSRTLATIACIIVMLSCCFVVGLPFGIWGLVVINKPEVKSHFT